MGWVLGTAMVVSTRSLQTIATISGGLEYHNTRITSMARTSVSKGRRVAMSKAS